MKNKSLWILLLIICILFCGYKYASTHLDEIMAHRANYYYKHNEIQKAQEDFEKAFELGLNDSKQREIYINSIINSPLTTDAQEKLVKFLQDSKNDTAQVKVEYFLYDIKREIHRKFPENYITNAVFNQKIMRWGRQPITYNFIIESDNEPPIYFKREIEAAFTEWKKATGNKILFEENNNNPNIIIKFETEPPVNNSGGKYVVAYTTPMIELNTLKNMEIIFYLKNSNGKMFTQNQIYNTALHEIAHALGFMGHSRNKDDIMYLTKDSLTEQKDIRENLTEADINTINLLYKIKPQITNIEDNKSEYIPYLVLGTKNDINKEKRQEARTYIKKAPKLSAGYIDLAEAYVAEKDYKTAIKCLKKALKYADSDDILGIIYFNLAVTHFYIDELNTAEEYLRHSMQIKDSAEKHYLLGEIYVRQGKTKSAIQEYSNLIAKEPANIEYVIALTNIYVVNRQYMKARKVLKSYFKLNPQERTNPRFEPYGIIKIGL